MSSPFHPNSSSSGRETNLPTAVCDLATGLADWTRAKSARGCMFHTLPARRSRRVGRGRHRGKHTVQADDFTHGCGVVVCRLVMWRGGEEEMSRRTRWAGGGWVGEVEAKVRSRGVYCLVRGALWSVLRGLLCGAGLRALASDIPVPSWQGWDSSASRLTNRAVGSAINPFTHSHARPGYNNQVK